MQRPPAKRANFTPSRTLEVGFCSPVAYGKRCKEIWAAALSKTSSKNPDGVAHRPGAIPPRWDSRMDLAKKGAIQCHKVHITIGSDTFAVLELFENISS